MNTVKQTSVWKVKARRDNSSRGVALILTLLLLTLLVAMTLAMTIAVTSDTLISKYYRNFRASFYAADSGVNIARQYMMNQLSGNAIANGTQFSQTSAPPLSSTDSTSTLANALAQYGSSAAVANRQINLGQGSSSWPGSFYIVPSQSGTLGTTIGTPTCSVPVYTGTATNAGPYSCTNLPACTGSNCSTFAITDFDYQVPYTITAIGQSLANEQQIVEDAGTFVIDVHVGAAGGTTESFADFGTFIDQYTECSTPFAPGVLTGPFYTNSAWTFENSGSYTFTGMLSSVASTFGWDKVGNSCTNSANTSQPGFSVSMQDGYTLGAPALPLPVNDFNQKEAVVDTLGNAWTSYTTAQQDQAMNAALKTVNGSATPYPVSGTTNNGVYMAYSQSTTNGVTTNTMTGGGIYVEGNADTVELSPANPTIGGTVHTQQVITIAQGSTTTTVTEDYTSNTTTISSAVTSTSGSGHNQTTTTTTSNTTILGVPENNSTGTETAATMLYVDGNIGNSTEGLSGPGQGLGAIQNGVQMTITAAGTVSVTGDVLYATQPVTTSGSNPGSVIAGSNSGQVLGIFTATGDIDFNNQQSNNNITVDAAIAMISQNGSGGWIAGSSSNSIDTVTLVGSRVANQAKSCYCTTRNLYFDQRFSSGGFAPPWFPATTITPSSTDAVSSVVTTVQRTQWLAVY